MVREIRIVIADDNIKLCEELCYFFSGQSSITVVGVAHDGEAALTLVKKHEPDLLLLDIVMPRLDGISVLSRLSERNNPKVIVMTAFANEHVVRRIAELGANYYVIKPFSFSALAKRIKEVIYPRDENPQIIKSKFNIAEKTKRVLEMLGMPLSLKGASYIITAAELIFVNWDLLHTVTKNLYPAVAQIHNATAIQVESSIRHAIGHTWLKSDPLVLAKYFGPTSPKTGRPTNADFLGRLVELVKSLDLK